jgi:putative transposase
MHTLKASMAAFVIFRNECLNDHWFTSLTEARIRISAWRRDYNEHRPHSALDYQTPAEFAATCRMQEINGCEKERS